MNAIWSSQQQAKFNANFRYMQCKKFAGFPFHLRFLQNQEIYIDLFARLQKATKGDYHSRNLICDLSMTLFLMTHGPKLAKAVF